MTNGDWIRKLRNKALAQYMTTFSIDMCDSCIYHNEEECSPKHCVQAWEDWLNQEFGAGMSKEKLDNLHELLCDFDLSYALSGGNKKVIDKAIEVVTSVMEVEADND